jgi:hypothetical protein
MAEPPLLEGAFHERLICVGEAVVAVRPVGVPGVLADDVVVGVTEDSDDALPVPTELIAETR